LCLNILYVLALKIIKISEAESCADGNIGYDIYFDKNTDQNFIDYLAKLGKIKIDNTFDVPYFKIIVKGYYTLKGSLGQNFLRMIVPESIFKHIFDEFEKYITNYQNI